MVTITVDNLGTAGAEVPVIVKFTGGEITKRLEVRAKSKGVIRVEIPAAPQEIVVNDGSVPESDTANNIFKIDAPREVEFTGRNLGLRRIHWPTSNSWRRRHGHRLEASHQYRRSQPARAAFRF